MKQNEAPEGMVATIGHPANGHLVVKMRDGRWRNVERGDIMDDEDFRAGWDIFHYDREMFDRDVQREAEALALRTQFTLDQWRAAIEAVDTAWQLDPVPIMDRMCAAFGCSPEEAATVITGRRPPP